MPEEYYSPGLETVVAGETSISTLEHGLSYRGYAVEELADRAAFEEVAYLLLHGALPRADELAAFRARCAAAAKLPDELVAILGKLPRTAPMMDVLRTGASCLAHFDPEITDPSPAAQLRRAERLFSQLPLVLATAFRQRQRLSPVSWNASLSFAANVLHMLTGQPSSALATRAMEATLIMYAEHEFNASTFAARVVCSTLSDLHSAVVAAIGALKGPLHGGANERVMEALAEVGSPANAANWLQQAFAEKRRIMGFGHRVYKTRDPRAEYLQPLCVQLATQAGDTRWEEIAGVIEAAMRREKQLPTNLDWPTARIYHYLGLPVELYTPLFAISRITGWSAHVLEQLNANRLMRPRSRYTGPSPRPFVPLAQR